MPNPLHTPWPEPEIARLKLRWLTEKALGYRGVQATLELLAAEFGRSAESVREALAYRGLYTPARCRARKGG